MLHIFCSNIRDFSLFSNDWKKNIYIFWIINSILLILINIELSIFYYNPTIFQLIKAYAKYVYTISFKPIYLLIDPLPKRKIQLFFSLFQREHMFVNIFVCSVYKLILIFNYKRVIYSAHTHKYKCVILECFCWGSKFYRRWSNASVA